MLPVAPPRTTAPARTLVLVAFGVLILLAGSAACRPGAADAPTIVLVTIDTLRADRVGCYGHANAGTPRLDALAASGTRFDAAQTTSPMTLPAHASIMTGRTIPAHRVASNGPYTLPTEVPTLAAQVHAAGYATGAFVSSKLLARRHGLDHGFDTYDDAMPTGPRGGMQFHSPERSGHETVQHALRWLDQNGRRPAFLWVHLWEPHTPYNPPPEFAARFGSDLYQGEIATADAALGELLDGLRAQGREKRMLVVVAGDHGESLGEHGEPTHGIFLYQATMHVPLVIAGPHVGVRAATVVNDVVSLADVAPTVLELAGTGPLPYTDGLSLAPVLRGSGPLAARDGVSAESHMPQVEFGWSGLRVLVHGATKVIDAPRPEVYDLAADPSEEHDLAAQRSAAVDAARRTLAAGLRRAVAAAPTRSASGASNEEDLAALRALGYAASGRRATAAPADLVDPRRTDPKDRQKFISEFHRAVSLTQSGDPGAALALFDELEREEPRNVSLLLEKGNALILGRRFDDALALFRRTVELDPQFDVGWHRIGQLLDARRDTAGAEAAYRRAVDVDPSNTMSLKALAAICYEQGRFKEGAGLLERVVLVDPTDEASAHDLKVFRARAAR